MKERESVNERKRFAKKEHQGQERLSLGAFLVGDSQS